MKQYLTDEVRTRLLADAYRRGYDYLPRWNACAPTTFAAVMDTLGYAGDQLVRDIWKASVGLTGGTGNMAVGTCGAVAGAAMAVSLSFDYGREQIEQDNNKMLLVNKAVAEMGKQVKTLFGHIVCQEIQFNNRGKAYHFSNPGVLREFSEMAMNRSGMAGCQEVTGTLARLAVEKILEYNPRFVRL